MRYFFSRHSPPVTRILLIESGSRNLIEHVANHLGSLYPESVKIDVVTCYPDTPRGITGEVFRVTDYNGAAGRHELLARMTPFEHTIAGILCSAEPIMTKWKWWLGWKLPSKLFIINENADYFYFDRGNWRQILQFVLYRAGLTGSAAVPALIRLGLFPLTLLYLLLYAATVHLRRRIRLL